MLGYFSRHTVYDIALGHLSEAFEPNLYVKPLDRVFALDPNYPDFLQCLSRKKILFSGMGADAHGTLLGE